MYHNEKIVEVEITQIAINPFQPRKLFNPGELDDLAASIQAVGLIQPPVVRPLVETNTANVPNTDRKLYELISGERRFRAAQLIGLKKIPVIVRSFSNRLSAQAALIENVQRVDLNPLELAQALQNLVENFGFNQTQLGDRIGKKRSTIANYLRLLSLPHTIQESLGKNLISMGHAKAILSLESLEKQHILHNLILCNELTVREAEKAALNLEHRKPNLEEDKKKQDKERSQNLLLKDLTEKIQLRLGTKVTIHGSEVDCTGKICIDFFSLDDLDRLLAILGID